MQQIVYTNSRGQSITLNSRPFVLEKIDGTGGTKTTLLTTKAPGQDGKSYHGTLLEERSLNITGTICANSLEDLYIKKQQICSVFNPKLLGSLIYTNDVSSHTIDCVVEDSPTFKDRFSTIQEFLIQLFCPNPFWEDIQESKEEIADWIGDFEFDLEIPEEGIIMEHRESSLIVNINNVGDVECGMRVEFTALATVVNPSILNVYTQEFIKVKRTLQAGDKIIINTSFSNKRVELIQSNGVTSNVFNWIDLQSTFLQLDVGDNLLRYDAEQGIDNLDVSIYYKPLYLGV
ncbi:phage tail family protein [Clostridium sp. WILCCON 0269]|uniref:Phage tail family protein n=1 Tax=Candidatus Clostridium eludens TaxID=3381663 RepID=A0ABW8SMM2_9CLOT